MQNLKTIKINVMKKNRKYFACYIDGYKAKLIIDENSKNIELGENEYLVIDKSIRSKYGTDLIFALATNESLEKSDVCTLTHHAYNSILVTICRNLGGKYDREINAWVFNSFVENVVEDLDYTWNSKLLTIEITTRDNEYGLREPLGPLNFYGYTLGRATGRDSGAKLGDGVALLRGAIDSGGSQKNWATTCSAGSIFRLQFPEKLLDKAIAAEDTWIIKQLENI